MHRLSHSIYFLPMLYFSRGIFLGRKNKMRNGLRFENELYYYYFRCNPVVMGYTAPFWRNKILMVNDLNGLYTTHPPICSQKQIGGGSAHITPWLKSSVLQQLKSRQNLFKCKINSSQLKNNYFCSLKLTIKFIKLIPKNNLLSFNFKKLNQLKFNLLIR